MNSPALGVVIVTYNSSDVIFGCLESLMGSRDINLRVVIVDNCSTDNTVSLIEEWARGAVKHCTGAMDFPLKVGQATKPIHVTSSELELDESPENSITIIRNKVNTGFAGGVNRGLEMLLKLEKIERFWVLNPDCIVPLDTAKKFASFKVKNDFFSLMGGRIVYAYEPYNIQIDGGTVNWFTGTTGNVGKDSPSETTPPTNPKKLDFISGASMVASRRFIEKVGTLPEEYFLYYEEADWAMRRGNLPLVYCPDAVVYHHAGTSIGSPTRKKMASSLSLYFKIRGRRIFLSKFSPWSLPGSYLYGLAKAAHTLCKGYPAQTLALLRALHGFGPSAEIKALLSAETIARISK